MRDSLDLKALRQEIAAHKKPAPGDKTTAAGWLQKAPFLVVGVVAGIFMTRGKLGRGYDSYINILMLFVAGALVWALFKALRDQRRNAPRIDHYAPAFVRRTNGLDTIQTVLMYVAALAWMAVAYLITTSSVTFIGVSFAPLLVLVIFAGILSAARNAGLGAVSTLASIIPYHEVKNVKGLMLLHTGQFNESEAVFRQMLERGHPNTKCVGVWMNNMGYALTLAKRYSEALPILEAAINIAPNVGNSYDSLATWYLEQKLDPQRALELTQIAIENTPAEQLGSHGVQEATRAHALALIGEKAQAETLINTALMQIDSQPPFYTGEIHRQIGFARLALGEIETARHHFGRAVELDPDGLFGKLAQQALRTELAAV